MSSESTDEITSLPEDIGIDEEEEDAHSNYVKSFLGDQMGVPLTLLDSRFVNGLPHTVLTQRERVFLSVLLGIIGIGSSFSMPVYWPALSDLAEAFDTTEARINYSVTSYLCLQATSPVFISSLSDVFGRRPVMIFCLIGGVGFNIALACTKKYWCLIFFRSCLAFFVAPLVSITVSSVGDLTTKRDRGSLTTLASGLTLIGQAIAPLLGAVMQTVWSWPAIFWMCTILSGILLLLVIVFVPETNKRFVGNLGVRPKYWYQHSPALWYLSKRIDNEKNAPTILTTKAHYNPWKPLSLCKRPAVLFILLPTAIQFGSWTILQTTMSVELQKSYDYTVLQVGLCFIIPGVASATSALLYGKLIDRLYKQRKSAYQKKYAKQLENGDKHLVPAFNIINCRLIPFIPLSLIGASVTLIFGWCIDKHQPVAIILVMAYIQTSCIMYPMNVVTTVLIDLFPDITGGVTALSNLFRCSMSAIFVSCLDKMNDAMTIGGTYTFMMAINLVSSLLVIYLMKLSQEILNKKEGYIGATSEEESDEKVDTD